MDKDSYQIMQTTELNTFFTALAIHMDNHGLQPNELETFFDGLADKLAVFHAAKKQMDRFSASDFTVFSYIKNNEGRIDEGKLSRILRDLLAPDGPHGQGDAFLVEFLRLIGCEECYSPGAPVSVGREIATNRIQRTQRRFDLLIDIRGVHGIAIENKPWALDQKDQITDYLDDLSKRYPDSHYRIVYLTKNGSRPLEYSARDVEPLLQRRTLVLMAYTIGRNSLLNWLDACQQVCQAEKVRWFLRDLSQYIQENIHYEASDDNDSPQ